MSTKNIALGILASKLDRGEIDSMQALEQAHNLGLKEKDDEEPVTVRYPIAKNKIYTPLVLEDFFDEND